LYTAYTLKQLSNPFGTFAHNFCYKASRKIYDLLLSLLNVAQEWFIQQAFQQNNTKNKCETLKEGANSISEKQGARGKRLVPLSNTVAIGNPERHMRKALHCGSKQQ